MRSSIACLAVLAALSCAGAAAAQDNANLAYQNALLARALSPADKAFCDAKAGGRDAYDKCRVTRGFIADVKSRQDKGLPPTLMDPDYILPAELPQVMDAMSKHGA